MDVFGAVYELRLGGGALQASLLSRKKKTSKRFIAAYVVFTDNALEDAQVTYA